MLMVRDMAKDEVSAGEEVAVPAGRARIVARGFIAISGADVEGVGWDGADDFEAAGVGSGTGSEVGPAALHGHSALKRMGKTPVRTSASMYASALTILSEAPLRVAARRLLAACLHDGVDARLHCAASSLYLQRLSGHSKRR